MISTEITSQNPVVHVDATTDDFLRVLEKLFKTGGYYPASHERTRALTTEFLAAAAEVRGSSPELVLDVRDGVLHLQGEALSADTAGVTGFITLLEPLAVVKMSLAARLSHEDLHSLVTMLPGLQQQLRERSFDDAFTFEGLPDGVSLSQKEFLTYANEGGDTADWPELREKIQAAMKELEDRGYDSESISMCKQLTRGYGSCHDEHRSLEDAGVDEHQIVIENLDDADSGDRSALAVESSLNTLVDLLEWSMLGDQATKTREAFQQLIVFLDRSVPDNWKIGNTPPPSDKLQSNDTYDLSIDQLQRRLDEAVAGAGPIREPDGPDQAEYLAIVCGFLGHDVPPVTARRLQAAWQDILKRRLSPSERSMIVRSVGQALWKAETSTPPTDVIDVLRTFGESDTGSPLTLLMEATRLCPEQSRARLWPYVLNEVLTNSKDDRSEVMDTARTWLLPVPSSNLGEALNTFVALRTVDGEPFRLDVAHLLPKGLGQVFATIIRHNADGLVARTLVSAMHEQPPSWIAACVLPLIRFDGDDHRDLYATLLDQDQSPDTLARLRAMVSDLVRSRLPSLPRKRRSEPWVKQTILALGGLHDEPVDGILKTILTAKKWWIVPTWPRSCRSNARTALQQIHQRRRV
jgi:hypothetical protein